MASPRIRKNRKRKPTSQSAGSPFSVSLRAARDLIDGGQQDQALAALNLLANNTRNTTRRAKILLLIGASESGLSRHAAAAVAYSRAAAFARQAADSELLLQCASGEIRSLLRAMRTEDAKAAATTLLAELSQAQQDYEKILTLTPAQFAAQGSIQAPAQPPRPTVVLTKIAHSFLEAGLTTEAQGFLLKAIQAAPNGASRARQCLARLALAGDNPAQAERFAREALLMGRFQAKTTAAWQLYLDARARQNLKPILEPDLLASFQQHAKARVASASIHSISRTLRAHSDPSWKTIAQSALTASSTDPIIATELEKLIQADAKLTSSQEVLPIAARALRLFRAKDVSAQEQVGHAKAYIRFSLLASSTPNVTLIIRIATERFGADHAATVRHAMALGAIQAKDTERARTWLFALLTDLQPGTEAWGKATWALARLEEDLERSGAASVWYFELAENTQTPPRFRIQAMLKGFRELVKSNGAVDTPKVSATVSSILSTVDDFKLALDAARQLALAGNSFLDLKLQAAQRGKSLASTAYLAAHTSREKLTILEYVARRQAWDLGDSASILERWDQLPLKDRSEFETLSGPLWYEYVSLVFRALTLKNRSVEAKIIVASIIDRDRSNPEGYVIVGTEYAEWLLRSGQLIEAFGYFEWIAKESPTHRKAALSHYWISLRYLKQGKQDLAKQEAERTRKCFGGVPALLPEWLLDAKAILLITNMNKRQALIKSAVCMTDQFFDTALDGIKMDIAKLH